MAREESLKNVLDVLQSSGNRPENNCFQSLQVSSCVMSASDNEMVLDSAFEINDVQWSELI